MVENKLIKFEGGALQKVGNAISVTNKLFALKINQLIPFRRGAKWGFCESDKRMVIDCNYDYVIPFNNEFANVKINQKWGIIDRNGKHIIPCKYDGTISFTEGLAAVGINRKYGFINMNGDIVIPLTYSSYPSKFSEGLSRITLNNKYGFIDREDKIIVPCIYDNVHSFENGCANVRDGEKWGTIDKFGNTIIPIEFSFEKLENLKGETVYPKTVKTDGKYFMFDKNGKQLNSMPYDCIDNRGLGFSEGLVDVEIDGKWGFIDIAGELIIPCVYDDVHGFFDGLSGISKNDYWGFIDREGNEIIQCIYEEVNFFDKGIALVRMYNGEEGYINKEGVQYWED